MNRVVALALLLTGFWFVPVQLTSQSASVKSEWDKVVESAKKEGKVIVSISTSAELRKEFESGFQKAYPGIELELNVARGAAILIKSLKNKTPGYVPSTCISAARLRSLPDFWRQTYLTR